MVAEWPPFREELELYLVESADQARNVVCNGKRVLVMDKEVLASIADEIPRECVILVLYNDL